MTSPQPAAPSVTTTGSATPAWLGEFLLLAAIWGASFLFMRLGAAEFGPLPTAGVRVGVAALFLVPLLLFSGQWPALRQHWKKILFAGLINSAIPFALYSYAVLSITTGLASILNATVPLFGALIAWAWLHDRLTGLRWLGLLIGFAGVALLAFEKASFKPGGTGLPLLACLAACICYGLAASYAKRYLGGVHPLATATGSQIGATLGLLLPTLWFWPAQTPGAGAWAAVVAMGIVCTGVAYILYFRIIEKAGPSRALSVTFLAPVFALFYGAVLLGEQITPWMVGCGVVIVLGTALSTGLLKARR